jgi:hypothetical protein
MNARIFKKLNKRAAPLCIALDPNLRDIAFVTAEEDECDGWASRVLAGTPGFGCVSGYYEPEWSDWSALGMLRDQVYWELVPPESITMDRPYGHLPGVDLGDWRLLFAHAEELVARRVTALAPPTWARL